VADIKKRKHLMRPLDKQQLDMVPLIGECQRCHELIEVIIGRSCPRCGYGQITDEAPTSTSD
jgi:hypothetical protein